MQDFTFGDSPSERPPALSVGQLNLRAKRLLETHLNPVWVEGEISNFSLPSSGHWYFSLKDSEAQIRCAMFRNRNSLIKKKPQVGDQVVIRGRISLYEPRGDYQLIAEHVEDAGKGLLQREFDALKFKLANEGLFDESLKRPLPDYISRVTIITSINGAALYDVLTILKRRNANIEVDVVPASVQGAEAAGQLIQAINLAEEYLSPDVIIIGRGGGSIEDLWAFNDENLARRIFSTEIPIVSAVGHEVDFSISDFVADLRAATPSAAAELVSREQNIMINELKDIQNRFLNTFSHILEQAKTHHRYIDARLKHPSDKLQQWQQRTDICEQRMKRALNSLTEKHTSLYHQLNKRLHLVQPRGQLVNHQATLQTLQHRLSLSISSTLELYQTKLMHSAAALDIVSPLSTMKRGYALAKDSRGNLIKSVSAVAVGNDISVRLQDGELKSTINSIVKTR